LPELATNNGYSDNEVENDEVMNIEDEVEEDIHKKDDEEEDDEENNEN